MKSISVAGIMFGTMLCSACGPQGDTYRLVGQMESERIEITAEVSEPIVERAVVEGQEVTAGQLLIRQDTARIEARLAEANASLDQARARLAELVRGPRQEQIAAARANVAGAHKALQYRETELRRLQDLFDRELASPDLRDQAQSARDAARASLESLEARLAELLSGTTTEELDQAEASARRIEAQVASLEIDRQRHSSVAPLASIVDSLLFEPGERPGIGQPMAILLSGDQAYAKIYVPESMRASVIPGVPVTVYVDGIDAPLEGIVRWVSSEAAFTPYFALTEDDRGRLSYAAKVDIVAADRRIPDGVPVEVALSSDTDD